MSGFVGQWAAEERCIVPEAGFCLLIRAVWEWQNAGAQKFGELYEATVVSIWRGSSQELHIMYLQRLSQLVTSGQFLSAGAIIHVLLLEFVHMVTTDPSPKEMLSVVLALENLGWLQSRPAPRDLKRPNMDWAGVFMRPIYNSSNIQMSPR